MADLSNKTPAELQVIISEAKAQLEAIQRSKHKEVIAQIKELAESIGVTVDIHEDGKKAIKSTGGIVPAKYRNPNDSTKTWTGRGMTPKWLQALIAEGRNKDEFLIS
ncbi:MAG: H-NS histone family protein [Methylococcaceae bacterium]